MRFTLINIIGGKMNIPENLKYSKDHEWVLLEGNVAKVGISDFAQHELTDIVFVELPEIGKKVEKDGQLAVVESVKAVSDVLSPLSGSVVEVNDALTDAPELINTSPYAEGWIARIEIADESEIAELLDAAAYAALIG